MSPILIVEIYYPTSILIGWACLCFFIRTIRAIVAPTSILMKIRSSARNGKAYFQDESGD